MTQVHSQSEDHVSQLHNLTRPNVTSGLAKNKIRYLDTNLDKIPEDYVED